MRAIFALLLLSLPALAGDEGPWQPRTEAELTAALSKTCETAKAASARVLLEFSAPWCGDCRMLHKLKQTDEVKAELASFSSLVVDVGRFDRHEALRTHFGVNAIAHWAVLAPTDCAAPVTDWPVKKSGTLEPAHGSSGPRTAGEVAGWLKAARE